MIWSCTQPYSILINATYPGFACIFYPNWQREINKELAPLPHRSFSACTNYNVISDACMQYDDDKQRPRTNNHFFYGVCQTSRGKRTDPVRKKKSRPVVLASTTSCMLTHPFICSIFHLHLKLVIIRPISEHV